MRKLLLLLAMTCLPVLRAESQSVTLSGSGELQAGFVSLFAGFVQGTVQFSALLPAAPTPTGGNISLFELSNVTFSFTQGSLTVNQVGTLEVFRSSAIGGFAFFNSSNDDLLNVLGAGDPPQQIFSGTTTAPTFVIGSYLTEEPSGAVRPREFRIAAATVPEPSALLLIATGVSALGVAGRRRRRQT